MLFDESGRSRWKPTRKGAYVVLGLFLFGALILGGLYLSPRAYPPRAPGDVPAGVPGRTMRFVAYDLACQHPATDPLFADINQLNADYVILQSVPEDDAIEIAERLGMQHSFHPQLYQRSENLSGRHGEWGNLILSRQSMYEGGPLGGDRGGFGVSAVSVVDERQFSIACLHLSPGDVGTREVAELERIWQSRGAPPMVMVVRPSDANPPENLKVFAVTGGTGGERFYLTKDWSIVASGTTPVKGTGLVPTWIDVTRAPAATQP